MNRNQEHLASYLNACQRGHVTSSRSLLVLLVGDDRNGRSSLLDALSRQLDGSAGWRLYDQLAPEWSWERLLVSLQPEGNAIVSAPQRQWRRLLSALRALEAKATFVVCVVVKSELTKRPDATTPSIATSRPVRRKLPVSEFTRFLGGKNLIDVLLYIRNSQLQNEQRSQAEETPSIAYRIVAGPSGRTYKFRCATESKPAEADTSLVTTQEMPQEVVGSLTSDSSDRQNVKRTSLSPLMTTPSSLEAADPEIERDAAGWQRRQQLQAKLRNLISSQEQ